MNGSKRKLDVYYKGRSVGTLAETVDQGKAVGKVPVKERLEDLKEK